MERKFYNEIEKEIKIEALKEFEKELRVKIYDELEKERKTSFKLNRELLIEESNLFRSTEVDFEDFFVKENEGLLKLFNLHKEVTKLVFNLKAINEQLKNIKEIQNQ